MGVSIPKVSVRLEGQPQPKARPRIARGGKGVFTPKATKSYEQYVAHVSALEMRRAPPLDEPVIIHIMFCFALPKTPSVRSRIMSEGCLHTKKPDIDNLAKSVLDGLQAGGVFSDDKQVVELRAAKVYAIEEPFTIVNVYSAKHSCVDRLAHSFYTKKELEDERCKTIETKS
jgi:Holliday junction resolvase RusA-like endonuclease